MSTEIKRRGRPPGLRAAQLELQRTLLEHPDLDKVIHKVFEVALDDQHKHQTVAQKILMDRAIPVNSFDKTFDNQLGINIHITTADIPKVINP